MEDQYEWMKFYEAAVLETDPTSLPHRIEEAKKAIGQRVVKIHVDDSERKAIVRTLNALSVLKREASQGPICQQCKDAHDPVTAINGRTFIARTPLGEFRVPLHTRCVELWASAHESQTLAPLRRNKVQLSNPQLDSSEHSNTRAPQGLSKRGGET